MREQHRLSGDKKSCLCVGASKNGEWSERWEELHRSCKLGQHYRSPISAVRRRHAHNAAEASASAPLEAGRVPTRVSRRRCTAMVIKYDELIRRMGLDAHPDPISASGELPAGRGSDDVGIGGAAGSGPDDDDESGTKGMRADEAGALVLVRRSTLLHLLRRGAEAEIDARRALALRPTMPAAHFRLGLALDAQGDSRGAAAALREGLRHDPRSLPLRASLDTVLRRIKGAQETGSRRHQHRPVPNQTIDAVSRAIQQEESNNDLQRKAAAARFSASVYALEQQLQAKAEESKQRAARLAELNQLRSTASHD